MCSTTSTEKDLAAKNMSNLYYLKSRKPINKNRSGFLKDDGKREKGYLPGRNADAIMTQYMEYVLI